MTVKKSSQQSLQRGKVRISNIARSEKGEEVMDLK
jgi:hypothetical protein